ncbi:1-phosphofructokinase [Frondihabitans sp. PhB188]|uniref:1-phosphofructokinase family hexose kinase n=1 Tax=Frondihabitans sp. PhB188 TaxID=2485200 RepID=UPI000F4A6B49|nr:PfkB family carbohydrate kinase [Frondihabitans sp. PhB188]ROQ30299.1 1-phosphofructokinase [Frondihabitans sp. PhB188]
MISLIDELNLVADVQRVGGQRVGRSRVVTLTPAPTVDRVYQLDGLEVGGVNRAISTAAFLAGKGINISRCLRLGGAVTRAVFPLRPCERDGLVGDDPDRSCFRPVPVRKPTRTNAVLITSDGTTTNVNQAPQALSSDEWEMLCVATVRALQEIGASWLVLAGALPLDEGTGTTVDLLPLVTAAHTSGVMVAVDTAGPFLRAALQPLQPVDLIKPNLEELAELVGRSLTTHDEIVRAAQEVQRLGVRTVLVSLGSAGLLRIGPDDDVIAVSSAVVDAVNTTGAGDAALAGYLSVCAGQPAEHHAGLRRAASWGALTVQVAAATPSRLADLPDITLRTKRSTPGLIRH